MGGTTMRPMYGRNHLRRAAAQVDGPDGFFPSPSALAAAFGHVWAAVAFCHDWPPGDRADLAGLIVFSRRYGSCADTAWKMTVAEFVEFRDELSRVVGRIAGPKPRSRPDASRPWQTETPPGLRGENRRPGGEDAAARARSRA